MKVKTAIKEAIAGYVSNRDEKTDAEEILTDLVESGLIDDEYELYDEEGIYDEALDLKVQALITIEIEKQLKNAVAVRKQSL